ncbi:MAG: hypothetical protein CL607_16655 [Anaerolineaceae bacterium]|nr:hypothetical protein [Anaerolineaceae bacterium]
MTTAFKPRTLIAAILIVILAAIPLQAQSVPEVELVGVIESMTLDSIVVNGLEVDISAAEMNTAITVDEIVQVEGVLLLDGSILAREVKGVDEGVEVGEAELIGTLESFTAPNMFVNGQMIDVSGAEVKQGVTVGQMVKVHAYTVTANTWVAREVEAYGPDDRASNDSSQPQSGEFEFSGTLEQIGQGFVVVSGQTISTEGAEIRNELMIGVRVRVHVRVQNGQMFARQIEFAFGRDDDNNNDNGNSNANSNDNNSNANDNANTNSNDNDDNGNSNDNSSVDTAITADQAIAIVLSIYPNTAITDIELKSMFGGTLVWDIETSHDIDIVIDAQTGVVLSIDMGGNSGNNNTNSNDNTNFNSNDNDDDSNGNVNFNSNDNDDDHNDNDHNDNDDDDDDDDNDDDDNDDDDDNSDRGSRDDDDD